MNNPTHDPPPDSSRPLFDLGRRTWKDKFGDTFRGIGLAVHGQSSFGAHGCVAVAVILCGWFFQVDWHEWLILLLCIGLVLTAEMFNTALERLAKAVDRHENPHLAATLDISAAAVLIASLVAGLVGGLIFLKKLWC